MFYIQQDEKILLFDEDKQRLQNTIAFTMPQYLGLEIKEVQEGYVIYKEIYWDRKLYIDCNGDYDKLRDMVANSDKVMFDLLSGTFDDVEF